MKRIFFWFFFSVVIVLIPLWVNLIVDVITIDSIDSSGKELYKIFFDNGGMLLFTLILSTSSLGAYYRNITNVILGGNTKLILVIPFAVLILLLIPSLTIYIFLNFSTFLSIELNSDRIFYGSIIMGILAVIYGISLIKIENHFLTQ